MAVKSTAASNASSSLTLAEAGWKFVEGYGRLFYLVDPTSIVFDSVDEVPNYIAQAAPYFFISVLFEFVILRLKLSRPHDHNHHDSTQPAKKGSKPLTAPPLNDSLSSVFAGMFQQVIKGLTKSFELGIYLYVWDNYRIYPLDPHSIATWIVAFLGVDMAYYWFHRYAHEINLFWGAHVVHHSSEYYNLTTALRQSIFQHFFSWMFYLPMALFVPPPMWLAHGMLNTLFQFWIHTEMVPPLGPLEYVLNTPSSHRVHHGRNPYCIDKNYAGVLIIWDIMFGTYQPEKSTEPVLFGLTHNIQSFDPFWIQVHHFTHVFKTAFNTPGFLHKVAVFFFGPGWSPAKPNLRLGDIADIPTVPNLYENPTADIGIHNPPLIYTSSRAQAFLATHLILQFFSLIVFQVASTEVPGIQQMEFYIASALIIASIGVLGKLLDGSKIALIAEAVRLMVFPAVAVGFFKPISAAVEVGLGVGHEVFSAGVWSISVVGLVLLACGVVSGMGSASTTSETKAKKE